ncbi:NifB/NifX family molybdenum-iron cluster-binding protein [bacterium]|nr:NifB/NifX family molybdenum-iron cluster-binding protein [bacterium]
MKIAFTTSGKDMEATLDPRFGRVAGFIVYDLETLETKLIDNSQNSGAVQGAGINAAETIIRAGANCLVTGNCGPKAFRVLQAAGVKVYSSEAQSLTDALDAFRSGTLVEMNTANVKGHW